MDRRQTLIVDNLWFSAWITGKSEIEIPSALPTNQTRTTEMVICTASMMQGSSSPHYALGSTDAEHERLIRQGVILAPLTERLFREAGIGPGQGVLDVSSGVGDVAMLAARLVGGSGEVVGIEPVAQREEA